MLRRVSVCKRATLFTSIATTPAGAGSQPALLLEFVPSLHCNLGAVELSLVFNTCFLGLLARSLAGISPGEVIELPERVRWENEVPDWEREQVDEHPDDIRPAVGRDNDKNGRETKDQSQKYKWNNLYRVNN